LAVHNTPQLWNSANQVGIDNRSARVTVPPSAAGIEGKNARVSGSLIQRADQQRQPK
jgi:hypothetical protein